MLGLLHDPRVMEVIGRLLMLLCPLEHGEMTYYYWIFANGRPLWEMVL